MTTLPRKKNRKHRTSKPFNNENKWLRARNSILANWSFWTSCCIGIAMISYTDGASYFCVLTTFVASIYLGYEIHRKTHIRDITSSYENLDNPIINRLVKYFPKLESIIRRVISHGDFHNNVHHDSNVNKEPCNALVEVYQNLLSEGLIAAAMCYWLRPALTICGATLKPHIPTIIFWSLLYTSVHNINYTIINPSEHINHHLFPNTNFGIDLMDILCDTKCEPEGFELLNHAVPNIIVITMIILYAQHMLR